MLFILLRLIFKAHVFYGVAGFAFGVLFELKVVCDLDFFFADGFDESFFKFVHLLAVIVVAATVTTFPLNHHFFV